MSRAKLKNAVARIMREANIDFDKIDQETIWERHNARLTLVQRTFYSVIVNDKSCEPAVRTWYRKILATPEFKEEVKQARSLLKDDTPDRWAEDQAAIEAYELYKYGTLEYANRSWAWGADLEAMLVHWLELLDEPERLRRENEKRRFKERAQVEKEHGKPIKLKVDHPHNTTKHYTPTFADDSVGWGLSYLYPFSDFPEYGGAHYVKLDNDGD